MKKIDSHHMKKVIGGFDNSVFNAVLPRDQWMNPDGSLMFPQGTGPVPVSGTIPTQESAPTNIDAQPLSSTSSKSSDKGK